MKTITKHLKFKTKCYLVDLLKFAMRYANSALCSAGTKLEEIFSDETVELEELIWPQVT